MKQFRDIQNGLDGWEDLILSCGWENLIITRASGLPQELLGKSLDEIGAYYGETQCETLARLLISCGGDATVLIKGMDLYDVEKIICYPKTLIGSDSLYSDGATHPRRSGTFPRIIKEYVKQKNILSIEQAIHKMTGLAADTFRIPMRGKLKTGNVADVLIFDPEIFKDYAGYLSPDKACEGVSYLWVNGQCLIREGIFQNVAAGEVLRI